jgi:hypothetical protein
MRLHDWTRACPDGQVLRQCGCCLVLQIGAGTWIDAGGNIEHRPGVALHCPAAFGPPIALPGAEPRPPERAYSEGARRGLPDEVRAERRKVAA